jgi:hypothetical protein
MPTWMPVDQQADPWLRSLGNEVKETDYMFDALTTERDLELIDAREPEALPWAI